MALERIASYGDLQMSSFIRKEVWEKFTKALEYLNQCPVSKDIRSKYLVSINGAYEDNQCVAYDDIIGITSLNEKGYTLRIENCALTLTGVTATGCTLNGVNYTINYGDGTSVTQSFGNRINYPLTDNVFLFPQTVTTLDGDGSIVFDTANASATIWNSNGTSSVYNSNNIEVSLSGSVYTIKVGGLNLGPVLPPGSGTTGTTTATVTFEAELPAFGYYTLFDVVTQLNSTSNDALQSLNSWVMPVPPYNPDTSSTLPTFTLRDVPIGSTVYYKVLQSGYQGAIGQVGFYKPSSLSGTTQIALQSTTLSDKLWNSVTVTQPITLVTIKMTSLLAN